MPTQDQLLVLLVTIAIFVATGTLNVCLALMVLTAHQALVLLNHGINVVVTVGEEKEIVLMDTSVTRLPTLGLNVILWHHLALLLLQSHQ